MRPPSLPNNYINNYNLLGNICQPHTRNKMLTISDRPAAPAGSGGPDDPPGAAARGRRRYHSRSPLWGWTGREPGQMVRRKDLGSASLGASRHNVSLCLAKRGQVFGRRAAPHHCGPHAKKPRLIRRLISRGERSDLPQGWSDRPLPTEGHTEHNTRRAGDQIDPILI
jgi:hypothetical protein